jgi:hypothetical protein
MPLRPAHRRRAPSTRNRARSHHAPPRLESLEPRTLLSGDIPAKSPPPPILLGRPVELTNILGDGQIGQALVTATPAARILAPPPPTKPAARAGFTWIVNQVDYGLLTPPAIDGELPPALEAAWPHDTFGEAQPIVATRPVVIGGAIQPGEAADFYRIPLDEPHLRIGFQPGDPASVMADRFVLYDESGRIVGEWTMPPNGDGMTVELIGTDDRPGHEVYIEIGPGGTGESSQTGESYVLLVEPASPGSSGTPDGLEPAQPPQGGDDTLTGQTPPAAPEPAGEAPASESTALAAPELVEIGQGGAGPLPLLAAAPFGGVLAGEPVLDAAGAETPVFDLALAGLLADPAEGPRTQTDEPGGPLRAASAEDALPLLAAALARPGPDRSAPAGTPAPTEGTLLVGDQVAVTAPRDAARDAPRRTALVRRTILPVGLGVLATLATTFHLAAPAAYSGDPRHRRPLPDWLRRWLRERGRAR